MKKQAIFGGTFDPIHNGHLHIAYEALYKLNLDKIIFIPSGNPPHKFYREITDGYIRYEMVNMAIREEEKFELSDYEIKKSGFSYTYETLEYFKNSFQDIQWYFLTGVDCLMELDGWKNIDKIMEICELVVFNRPGFNKWAILRQKERVEKKYNKKIIFLDIPLLDISSTDVRRLIKENKNVRYFLPEGVYNTIKELKLYI
ncbi:Nicotinate-nucleotide adenylyltransferase [Clostridium liquoris]|jgi:nicotinate-nucleotide adenylyltransferase|uniref:Probable nicotinate-nucleotide adenylyltransferase n=1 Tax=Clostridium liquoris TaxID=1289519 RepID=A0A2T0B140_9CLOT|nr:nicotinate-nucleotide adenylyltransferase [Clostridium liquoris]PRR77286.1 Nicotinate-nucleotide adenylyltransferase [Clostridium liquoris]